MDEIDKISKIFNMEVFNSKPPTLEVQKQEETGDKKEDDFDLSRETLRDLIQKNNAVIDEMISIARSAETARPFEVVGQLVKTQSEIAKDLLQLHKQKKDIEGESADQKIQQQNNIVFAGSTSDLMKMISASKANTIENK
jgi:hypothetical protein